MDNENSNLIISISGDPGSGKTTVKNLLADKYKEEGLEVVDISIGNIFREMAQSMNMHISEFNQYVKGHPEVDKMIDNRIIELGKKIKQEPFSNKAYIIDSRMAWNFIPDSLKVRLSVDPLIAGERVFNAERSKEDSYNSIEDATVESYKRKLHEINRYKEKYDVDIGNPINYDLVINTSFANEKDVANVIKTCAQYKQEDKPFAKLWRSPKTFFPTQSIRDSFNMDHEETRASIKEKGFFPDCPVSALSVDGLYYVRDGHNRLGSAIDENVTIVPYSVDGKDNSLITDKAGNILSGKVTAREYVLDVKDADVYDFEDCHGGFRYNTYPWLPKSELLQKIDNITIDQVPDPKQKSTPSLQKRTQEGDLSNSR